MICFLNLFKGFKKQQFTLSMLTELKTPVSYKLNNYSINQTLIFVRKNRYNIFLFFGEIETIRFVNYNVS